MTSTPAAPTIESIEAETFVENDGIEFPPPDIISYNELRSCADLYRMYEENILEIRADFQREIVWKKTSQTRFIDSLIKQLPIPSMCFSLDYKTQRWQVIDGLQRMSTIVQFLGGDSWRLSRLPDIDPSISRQYVPDFQRTRTTGDANLNQLNQHFLRVQNVTLPITVIRCDSSNSSHIEYLFTIFHRLNTGSVRLNNQEIRNCIFSGSFNDLLHEVDRDTTWLKINGRSEAEGDRYRGQELILRFFAFREKHHNYKRGLAAFLNSYMGAHREPGQTFLDDKRDIFERTVTLFHDAIYKRRRRGRRGISVLEATLVGLSLNLEALEQHSSSDIRQMYLQLLRSEEFSEEKLREGLSGTQRVQGRMSTAERLFSGQGND